MPLIWHDPKVKHICQGKMYLSKSQMTPQNEESAKKKYFTIAYT